MTRSPITGAVGQLRALAALRWQMVRRPGVRVGICLSILLVAWLLETAVTSAGALTAPALAASVALAPAAFLGFGVLAVVAPLTAGGGTELVPSAQLVAFPVRPLTQFLGGLLLAPVNLVWVLQLLVLAAETSFLTIGGHRWTGGAVTAAYVICLTVSGQALAWSVIGLRQSALGRAAVTSAGALGMVALVLILRSGQGGALLAGSPTRLVVRALEGPPDRRWVATTAGLLALTGAGLLLGARACAGALRRPERIAAASGRLGLRRRPQRRSALAELVALDRASAWRAPAVRRGGFLLAILPTLVAVGAATPWSSLVVLPGLVAAGAGLLFGINAFSLDGSGAIWLASLPHDPRLLARAKLIVLSETVAAAVVLSAVTGAVRSPGRPTTTELTGILTGALATGALVIATCLSLSIHRPHRADLSGPRDAVAPPGALAAGSACLAIPAGLVGLLLEAATTSDVWWLPPVLGLPVLLGALLWLRRSMAAYGLMQVRAEVVQVVSTG